MNGKRRQERKEHLGKQKGKWGAWKVKGGGKKKRGTEREKEKKHPRGRKGTSFEYWLEAYRTILP